MSSIGVLHIVDALRVGGVERVAVNLVNLLPRLGCRTHLCTTREEGPFASLVAPEVGRLALFRRSILDWTALRRLLAYIRTHNIQILHAHGSALFFARVASVASSRTALVWHDHYGRHAFNDRPVWLYRTATHAIGGVIAVNQPLAAWSKESLRVPAERVWYIPNLADMPSAASSAPVSLPGVAGKRIVCLANIRPQKDHGTLLRAMALVASQEPEARLFLVGDFADAEYKDSILRQIAELQLKERVFYLGRREDVPAILAACDVAILSSLSEGLPIALLEYGMAGLPAISTDVGQCAEVLGNGAAGILVPPASPERLAEALLSLLASAPERARLGQRLRAHVSAQYGPGPILDRIGAVYQQVLHKTYRTLDDVPRPEASQVIL